MQPSPNRMRCSSLKMPSIIRAQRRLVIKGTQGSGTSDDFFIATTHEVELCRLHLSNISSAQVCRISNTDEKGFPRHIKRRLRQAGALHESMSLLAAYDMIPVTHAIEYGRRGINKQPWIYPKRMASCPNNRIKTDGLFQPVTLSKSIIFEYDMLL